MTTPAYDYAALDPETRIIVQQEDKEFDRNMGDAGTAFIRACHNLKRINDALRYPKGEGRGPGFVEYIRSKGGMSERTAYRMLDVAKMFANLANIPAAPSALYLLASPATPEPARTEALAIAAKGEEITHARAKAIVEKHKPAPPVPEPGPGPAARELAPDARALRDEAILEHWRRGYAKATIAANLHVTPGVAGSVIKKAGVPQGEGRPFGPGEEWGFDGKRKPMPWVQLRPAPPPVPPRPAPPHEPTPPEPFSGPPCLMSMWRESIAGKRRLGMEAGQIADAMHAPLEDVEEVIEEEDASPWYEGEEAQPFLAMLRSPPDEQTKKDLEFGRFPFSLEESLRLLGRLVRIELAADAVADDLEAEHPLPPLERMEVVGPAGRGGKAGEGPRYVYVRPPLTLPQEAAAAAAEEARHIIDAMEDYRADLLYHLARLLAGACRDWSYEVEQAEVMKRLAHHFGPLPPEEAGQVPEVETGFGPLFASLEQEAA